MISIAERSAREILAVSGCRRGSVSGLGRESQDDGRIAARRAGVADSRLSVALHTIA
jgi:hypothetical protein